MHIRPLLALGLLMLLGACAGSTGVTYTTPLPRGADNQPAYGQGYRLSNLVNDPKGELIVVMAFSGGGKRSAAFGHGALRGMRDITLTEDGATRTLLDEVDYISGVSGGSFPAAHFGLFHDKSFETFPEEFLYRDINSYIYGTYLLPWNWRWAFQSDYGTNDRMAEIYDRLMFHGATYADLIRMGLPVINIDATDVINGTSFAFVQGTFDLICSNLANYPVARAVAASNGFPVLFAPITVASHRKECGAAVPHVADAIDSTPELELSRRAALANIDRIYLDGERTQYVHLMDGGIGDNLALRGLFNQLIYLQENKERFHRIAHSNRRVLIISVDGESKTNPALGQKRDIGGLGAVIGAVSGTQIDSYNFDTLLLAQQQVKLLVDQLIADRCAEGRIVAGHPCDDVRGKLVHISLRDVANPAVRAQLQAIPTGLTIPRADVDLLLQWGERLVRENSDIHALIDDLDAKPQAAVEPHRSGG